MKNTLLPPCVAKKACITFLLMCSVFWVHGQWLKMEGLPGGGRQVINLKRGQNNLFITTQHGLWRSSDSGGNWLKIPEFPGTSFVSTDGPNILAYYQTAFPDPVIFGVYQSSDDGLNWKKVPDSNQDSIGIPIRIWGEYVFAKTNYAPQKIYRSKDFGATWEFVSNEDFIFIPDGNKMYQSKSAALLESSDGGLSWDTSFAFPFNITLRYKKGNDIILTSGATQSVIVHISRNGGSSWNAIPLPQLNYGEFNRFLFHQNKVYAFRYNGKEALVSDLAFLSFQNVYLPEGETEDGDVLSVGNDLFVSVFLSGLLISPDGVAWHKSLTFNQSGGTIKAFDGRLYAIPGSGIYRLTTDKLHWESIAPDFELEQVQGMWVDSNYIALVAQAGFLWISGDAGQSFKHAINEENGSWVSGITNMGKSGGRLFGWDYNFGEGLRNAKYSDDHGFKWRSLKPVLNGLAPLKMDASNGQIHLIDSSGMLFRWNITTQIFDQISTAPIPFQGTEETYALCPTFVKGETYIVTEPAYDNSWYGIATHYFVSTDAGQSWTEHPVGLGNMVSSGDTIFATNLYQPLAISTDQAATWQSFSEGMESDPFWLDVLDGEVFASSFNQVYRRKTNGELPTVPTAEPTSFSGIGAFPNPFSDHFSIQFSKQKPVTAARLYDMLGRQIVLPEAQFFDNEILFSGMGHLPRGVYFLEIGFGGSSSLKKMMKF